jgi:hypothetical protein
VSGELRLPTECSPSISFFASWGIAGVGRDAEELYTGTPQQQDWVGISLATSVMRHLKDLGERLRPPEAAGSWQGKSLWNVLGGASIPWHPLNGDNERTTEGYAVIPVDPDADFPTEISASLDRSLDHIRRLRSLAPNPEAQRKHASTREFIAYYRNVMERMRPVPGIDAPSADRERRRTYRASVPAKLPGPGF